MANKQAIMQLHDFIAGHRELPFDMARATPPTPEGEYSCGTAGCIGGFAVALWPELGDTTGFDDRALGEMLEMDRIELDALCYPGDFCRRAEPLGDDTEDDSNDDYFYVLRAYSDISREDALHQLARLAEGKNVDWSEPSS